ncbi:MAG: class I SAM-dependent methyltransferase [Pseudomonadota bacterium]
MSKTKIDTRAIGLEVGSELSTWLTGSPNLHYGLWDGLEVNAGNLGAAQTAYTDKLFGYLPDGPLSILDIGGGAGVTARRLIAMGHRVEIVVPSDYLAGKCREIAPEAAVHETTFENFATDATFDVCLFSESFQYIPLGTALQKARGLTKDGGHILIADCFRAGAATTETGERAVGGGHRVAAFRDKVAALNLQEIASEDITEAVAPSIDLEQSLFNVLGTAVSRIDQELTTKRPFGRKVAHTFLKMVFRRRGLEKLDARLRQTSRTSAAFLRHNVYLISLLRKIG